MTSGEQATSDWQRSDARGNIHSGPEGMRDVVTGYFSERLQVCSRMTAPAAVSETRHCTGSEATLSLGCPQLESSWERTVRARSWQVWGSSDGQFWVKGFPPSQTCLELYCTDLSLQSSSAPSLLYSGQNCIAI